MINMRGAVVVKHYTGGTWVDSTNGILQVDITRGIPQYDGCWSQVQPGQLTLRSRDLSLKNVALQTRIRIEVDGTPIFTGKVFDISTEYVPKEDSIVTLIGFDELGALALKKFGHQTIIGGDYESRTVASFMTLPYMLSTTQFTQGEWEGLSGGAPLQGTDYEGTAVGYPMAPTNYGQSGFNPPAPAPGASSDSTWGPYLADTNGLIIANPTAQGGGGGETNEGYGTPVINTWVIDYSNNQAGIHPNGFDGIAWDILKSNMIVKPGVTDGGHPLYGDSGFYKKWYKGIYTPPSQISAASWAALMTTNDTDALTLFLKSEQSEAGFGYVDALNRFRLYNRAVVENDVHLSKATFKSDGTGLSYNNIKVTNGWEGVVNGVTVSNVWSNDWIDFHDLAGFTDNDDDGNITGYYQNAPSSNRDGTTTSKTLNFTTQPSLNPPKDYEWLGYNIGEQRQKYLKYTKLNNNVTPIFKFLTRDPSLDKLTTVNYFQGKTGLGTKQLVLNTNYAFAMASGPGYLWNRNGTTKAVDRPTQYAEKDYNVIERSAELADYILTNYANPEEDIRAINFDVHPQDLDTIKVIDIYDRIDIDHDYAGFVRDKQYCVMGITHSITPNSWNVTYQLWNQDGRP
jgi:hypothetical protein